MKYPMISLKDEKIGFGAPQAKYSEEVALREFVQIVKTNPFGKDLVLYKVGEFNEENGKIEACEPKILERGENICQE